MKYQIGGMGGFPVGQYLIPAGSIINNNDSSQSNWSRIAGNCIPPPNAMPLDQNTYNIMRTVYRDFDIPVVGAGIVRTPDTGSQ